MFQARETASKATVCPTTEGHMRANRRTKMIRVFEKNRQFRPLETLYSYQRATPVKAGLPLHSPLNQGDFQRSSCL